MSWPSAAPMDARTVDAVLSYHLNPYTCGVAKFNLQLAARLGVPCRPLERPQDCLMPLLSIKTSETTTAWVLSCRTAGRYDLLDLLLHDAPDEEWHGLILTARRVYAANPVIAEVIRPVRADVVTVFCPSTIHGNADRGAPNIFSFGMAHKAQRRSFERLKELLDGSDSSYTVSVSTGVHEGSSWDEAHDEHAGLMRGIFGDRLRMLGFLADDAVASELNRADMVALFYEPAVRANNTTLWAALEAGACVVTNLDSASPPELVHGVTVYDIQQLPMVPSYLERRLLAYASGRVVLGYSWDRLVSLLEGSA